jgi:predicted membrane-bound mannosyltransferase
MSVPEQAERPDAEPVTAPRAWWFRTTVVVGILAGIALRIWLLRLPTGVLDGDEAIVGLMARHLLHHHEFTTFYWGQNYGGSLTAIVMAGVFSVFGSSTTTLKAVPIGMSAIAALLVWRLGRRTIGEQLRMALHQGARLLLGVHHPRARVPDHGVAARR